MWVYTGVFCLRLRVRFGGFGVIAVPLWVLVVVFGVAAVGFGFVVFATLVWAGGCSFWVLLVC